MVKYNKAIRDKIPEIIKNSGNNCNVKKLTDDEFLIEIEAKLREELEEYFQSKSVEELADIIEVVNRISVLRGVSEEELEKIREKKSTERGKFDENLFLLNSSNE